MDRQILIFYFITDLIICILIFVGFLPCDVIKEPRADSGVVRIDPLHFLAGCCTRRLNQV